VLGVTLGTSGPSQSNDYESGAANFVLPPRYPGVLDVAIHRCASSAEAQHALEKTLQARPQEPGPKENYKGAWLYRNSDYEHALCQSQEYIFEILGGTNAASPLVMKVLDAALAEVSSTSTKTTATNTFWLHIFKGIEQRVPELMFSHTTVGPLGSSFNGEEYAEGIFALSEKGVGDPREFARQGVRDRGLTIKINRYPSSGSAKEDIDYFYSFRPEFLPAEETHKGATACRYDAGPAEVACQFNQYIIEVSPSFSDEMRSLVMKALDVVLAELDPPPSGSKGP
jgi:hypothetical protein